MLSPAEDGAERNAYPDLAHTLRGCGAPIISGGLVNRPPEGHHYRIWAQRREYGFGPHRSLLLDELVEEMMQYSVNPDMAGSPRNHAEHSREHHCIILGAALTTNSTTDAEDASKGEW